MKQQGELLVPKHSAQPALPPFTPRTRPRSRAGRRARATRPCLPTTSQPRARGIRSKVTRTAPAYMVALGRRRRLTLVGAGELVLKVKNRTLDLAVCVACTTAAAVEAACGCYAAGGSAGCAGVKRRGHAGGGGSLWCANKVTGAAAAGVDVGVCCHGWVWLGDGVAGHCFDFGCVCCLFGENLAWCVWICR